jgi:hypothetical protein
MWKWEKEKKYIKDYIVLSSADNNILQETFIYKEAMSSDQKTLEYLRYGINPNRKDRRNKP